MKFSRQEYWSGLPFPTSVDLPNPGIEPGFPALQADSLPSEPPRKCMIALTGFRKTLCWSRSLKNFGFPTAWLFSAYGVSPARASRACPLTSLLSKVALFSPHLFFPSQGAQLSCSQRRPWPLSSRGMAVVPSSFPQPWLLSEGGVLGFSSEQWIPKTGIAFAHLDSLS